MKQYYDWSCQSVPEYKVGDKVWLSLQNYSSNRPMKKLNHKWAGPFAVMKVISPATIKLHLSTWEKNIHPIVGGKMVQCVSCLGRLVLVIGIHRYYHKMRIPS